jgi:uncharacterized protein
MPALPDPDLDRLEQYLNAPERADSTLPLDMVQGLLAAVASAPEPIPQAQWLPEVLGESHRFATDVEEKEITGLLARLAEETARQLNGGEGFDFILYGEDGAEDLASWAEGYLIGVDLSDPPWDDRAGQDDVDTLLFPFLALTGEAKEIALDAGEEWMSEAEEAKMLAEIREGLATHLMDVREFWLKKYKSCHGQ